MSTRDPQPAFARGLRAEAHLLAEELLDKPEELSNVPLRELVPGAQRFAVGLLNQMVGLDQPIGLLLVDEVTLSYLERQLGFEQGRQLLRHLRAQLMVPKGWPPSEAALRDWAQQAGVTHLLNRAAHAHHPFGYFGRQPNLAQLFDDAQWNAEGSSMHDLGSRTQARARVWRALQQAAAAVADARESPLPGRPMLEGVAGALAARLERHRWPLLQRWPRLRGAPQGLIHVLADRGVARVSFAPEVEPETHHVHQPVVTVSLRDSVAPECDRGERECFHLAYALDGLLDQLEGGHSYEAQTLLTASTPSWGKVLASVAPRRAETPAARFAGFRVKLEELKVHVEPLELATGAKKPRRADLDAWLEGDVTAQERRVLELLSAPRTDVYGYENVTAGEALWALRGHPSVMLRDVCTRRDEPVKVEGDDAVLTFVSEGDELCARWRVGPAVIDELRSCAHTACAGRGQLLLVPRPGELWLGRLGLRAVEFAKACDQYGRRFPAESHAELLAAVSRLNRVPVELPDSLRGVAVAASTELLVRAMVAPGPGLDVSLHLRPLNDGPACAPGHGPVELSASRAAGRVWTKRDLAAERRSASELARRLGLSERLEEEPEQRFRWELSSPEAAVETAARLQQLVQEGVRVEFPAGALEVSRAATLKDLRLSVRPKGEWFSVEGDATLDGLEVPLARVLEAVRGGQRWVALGERKLARLSAELAKALAPLALSAPAGDGAQLSLPQLAALDALKDELGALQTGATVARLLERMSGASVTKVKLPRGFKGELRDYQREGFEWLSRLASWAPGAVLADDMGLGKTVQALALLSSRAKLGPALVVAPTSVTANWVAEAARFVPSLAMRPLHEGDRAEVIAKAKAGEVLVTSWTLMARDIERLEQRELATVVLDESQALKNAGTLRAKAARRLKAGFVLGLTGTPLENHLGELWSLFRVAVPGLFGSEEVFRERWWAPIEAGEGDAAWASLKGLVKPFLLRRRKDEVAKELPSKTEITLLVEPTTREAGVYEAARREALESLEGAVEADGEQSRFHVLAALTRMRQLACHVGLVDESWAEGSTKLSKLVELLTELKDEGHRVLVFSQFTTLLAKAQAALEEAGLSWLLLQGDTPQAERAQRVAAFQRGDADVFLLSLKAGGTGLNLTAADYVIHLDPWWNPAVEDQASDRAHRIGQTKPVTVYRLVAQGTIEEKILALHGKKRALVESVLEGTHAAGKLSAQELVELLRAAG